MFCPKCGTEYREGFTACSDCGTTLVTASGASSPNLPSDEMEILWSGTDPEFAEFLADALDRAELQHRDDKAKLDFLPALQGSVFKISVTASDKEAAQRVLQELIDANAAAPPRMSGDLVRDGADMSPYRGLSRRAFRSDKRAAPFESVGLLGSEPLEDVTPDDIVENIDAGEATCEVWSGNGREMAETFKICLREVGIDSVIAADGGMQRVFVIPAAETRAKEVIREIIEQTPPV